MSFQLFPPPQKKPNRPISLRRPQKPASPEPALELAERAKSPVDFHELVIEVNSEPISSVSVPVPAPAPAPAQASSSRQSSQSAPVIAIPEPARTRRPVTTSKSTIRKPLSPISEKSASTSPLQANVAPLPETGSPSRQTPASEKNTSPIHYPDRQATASPSFSDSTTLVRSNSAATQQTPHVSPHGVPAMRSIFPRYNPNVPLSQQQYKPTQPSPTEISKDKISRPSYSPKFYIPHSNVSQGRLKETPCYTPARELNHLWNAANGKPSEESKRTFSLQMHGRDVTASSSSSREPTLLFGPSPAQPMYSLKQYDVQNIDSTASASDVPSQELLISRHHPTQPKSSSFPIAHLTVHIPPPHAPQEKPESFYQDRSPTLITTIHPKLASLAALEAAAQTTRAAEIARDDPTATSQAAARLAAEAVAKSEAEQSCLLVYCPVSEQLVEPYATHKTGTYELRHPKLGAFPIVVQGDVRRDLDGRPSSKKASSSSNNNDKTSGSITILNPYATPRRASSATSTAKHAKNPSAGSCASTSTSSTTCSHSDPEPEPEQSHDEVLARLALASNTLTLDAAALSALAAPYLLDVAVCAVFAVCAAETLREGRALLLLPSPKRSGSGSGTGKAAEGHVVGVGGGSMPGSPEVQLVFEGPPTRAARGGVKGEGRKHAAWFGSVGKAKAKAKAKTSDLEAQQEEEEKLPLLVRVVLALLTFAFKFALLILLVGWRVLRGVLRGVGRCVDRA
ncbi:uncharacterized protein K452DRAFT_303578 [Aplosporella prunicola CBS 121167]|uniref:Uncharacterized protein n=1 Tax=Aplosporella prunicola CBS 121167 TaxID=1176127 RepID=A0A6A6AXV1_9PEZI|nr:uncharacterized protein K452DRAFT_303578 [Aplosporella prunicola CBS 121167]KAF2135391.1 hypothetical protein K452DRAFT_303578 [Aplosporella prunicola CBS 121167]